MKRLLTVAAVLLASALPVHAAGVLDPLLGTPGDCYARQYDMAHLKSHPRQMVEYIYIAHDEYFQDPREDVTLRFGLITRDGKSYEGVGLCQGNVCGVEGDGGRFSLTPTSNGLRLDVDMRRGMHAEGETDFIYLEDTDDTVFLLSRQSPRACDF